MRAHDVRSLTICKKCNNLGNRFDLIKMPSGSMAHGECAYEELGIEGILKLPQAEIMKFTIAQIGIVNMARLVAEVDERG